MQFTKPNLILVKSEILVINADDQQTCNNQDADKYNEIEAPVMPEIFTQALRTFHIYF